MVGARLLTVAIALISSLLICSAALAADPPQADRKQRAAVEACRNLQLGYALHRDAGDIEAYLELFTPDARFEIGGRVLQGRGALRAPAEKRMAAAPVRQVVSNQQVEVVGPNEATGLSYATVVGAPNGEPKILAIVEYHDRYGRLGAKWRIAERQAVIVFPAAPRATPNRPRDELGSGATPDAE